MSTLQRFYPENFSQFLRSWIDDPLAVGAVAPSGRALARLITRDLHAGARVMEFGPGTGTVTNAILDRGVAERDLYLLEQCPGFVDLLARQFSAATVICADATETNASLSRLHGSMDFVISGLPLVLFRRAQRSKLLQRSFELLNRGGAFYQFTYAGRCPINRRTLRQLNLVAVRVGVAALNMPPAFVYRISRKGE